MVKSTSQLAEKCQKCSYVDICDTKRKEACAYLSRPEPMVNCVSACASTPVREETLVKHSYRDIKIGPTQTMTIDLEDVKKDLTREFYRAIGCPSLQFGR